MLAPAGPDFDRLFEAAIAQDGLFTTQQAAEAGYSPQLLVHHVKASRFARVMRGVYRLVHFPAGEHDDLVAAWLWTDRAGVASHDTALSLHGLSDAMPTKLHLTLPADWRRRRLRVPPNVVLHHADVGATERTFFGPVPATSPTRTLVDCAHAALAPELLQRAARQALRRGLVSTADLAEVDEALRPFGGLGA